MKNVETSLSSPPQEAPAEGPATSAELAQDIRRIRVEEQAKIERRRQEEVARLRELSRFD